MLFVAAAALAAMTLVLLWGVFARYVLGAPGLWPEETASMLNTAVFLFGAGPALLRGEHVAVDLLSKRFPPRLARAILGLFLLLLFAPLLGWLVLTGWERFAVAYATGEVDDVSPWRRPVWPFLLAVLIGLIAYFASAVVAAARLVRRG